MSESTSQLRKLVKLVRAGDVEGAYVVAEQYLTHLDSGGEGADLSGLTKTEQRVVSRLSAAAILGGVDPNTGRMVVE